MGETSLKDSAALLAWQYLKLYPVIILLVGILFRCLYKRYATPLRKYPGPVLASCTRLWQVWTAWSGEAEEHYMKLHRKYGPIVRIGPSEISFSSPDAASDLFKIGKGFHKADNYTVHLPNGAKDIFTEIREDVHASKKRFAVPAYSIGAVQQHNGNIDELMTLFISKLDNFATTDEKTTCDLGNWIHYLAFDILGEFAFSKPFGFLDAGIDVDSLIALISRSTYETGIIGHVPFVESLTRSNPLWRYIPFLPANKASLLRTTALEVLNKNLDPESREKKQTNLLTSLLEAHKQNPDKFAIEDVLAISMGAIGAGSDSTASTMHSFCWNVLSKPNVHEKLVAELHSSQLSEIVQYNEGISLPYFQACLKEAMRLQPAVGFNILRIMPNNSAAIDGVRLPTGTKIAVNAWVMHRNKEVFGDDADSFRPERWLECDNKNLKTMERYMFQFGGGSHLCIGRHLALFEMNKILPELFRRYEIRLVHPEMPLRHRTGFFYTQEGLDVYIQKRNV